MSTENDFPTLLTAFFTERLMQQRRASPNTIASYRDTFRLLLQYVQANLKKTPSTVKVEDLDALLVGDFLTHIEKKRHNSARSRNVRLAAIHSLFAMSCGKSLNMPPWLSVCWPCPQNGIPDAL